MADGRDIDELRSTGFTINEKSTPQNPFGSKATIVPLFHRYDAMYGIQDPSNHVRRSSFLPPIAMMN